MIRKKKFILPNWANFKNFFQIYFLKKTWCNSIFDAGNIHFGILQMMTSKIIRFSASVYYVQARILNFYNMYSYNSIRFRIWCKSIIQKAYFDFIVLIFIAANCITLAMERPNIPPFSMERYILNILNHLFTSVFTIEMLIKVLITY